MFSIIFLSDPLLIQRSCGDVSSALVESESVLEVSLIKDNLLIIILG